MKNLQFIAKIILSVLFFTQTISLQAQNDYTLDSTTVATPGVQNEENKTSDSIPSSSRKFWQVMRTLFGLEVQAGYSYTLGNYELGSNVKKDGKKQYLPIDKFQNHNAYIKLGLSTPVITLSQTWTVNSFSNKLTKNIRYTKTHADCFSIVNLGVYLDKYKDRSTTGTFFLLSMLLPVFDRSNIQSENYGDKTWRIGAIYNMFSYEKKDLNIKDITYKVDGIPYDNFNVSYKYSQFNFLEIQGLMEMMRTVYFKMYQVISLSGGSDEDMKDFAKANRIMSYIPIPTISLYSRKGSFILKNDIGKELLALDLKGGGITLGLQYTGNFFIPKAHLAIIPQVTWKFYDKSFAGATNYDANAKAYLDAIQPYIRNTSLQASIGIQYIF